MLSKSIMVSTPPIVDGGLGDVWGVPSQLLGDGGDPLLLPSRVADGGGEGVDEGDLGGHASVRHHAGFLLDEKLHRVAPETSVHLRLDVVTCIYLQLT